MSVSRRQFCEWLGGTGLAATATPAFSSLPQPAATPQTGSHIGTLYPFVQKQADRSLFELSYLQPRFRSLSAWQKVARARVLDHLFYTPPPIAPQPEVIRRADRGDYIQEYLTFQTTPGGLQVVLNGSASTATVTRTVIVGSTNSVSAVTPQTKSKKTYSFQSWSDGGTQTHSIVADASTTTYTARFKS